MTQEEKQLLFIDLCGRFSSGVMVSVQGGEFEFYKYPYQLTAVGKFGLDCSCKVYNPVYTPLGVPKVEDVKPYLRPMSSMTEEEQKVVNRLIYNKDGICTSTTPIWVINESDIEKYVDFCNSHYLDWRGLIPKGLALEAPKGMY